MYKYWVSFMKYFCLACMLLSEVMTIICIYEQDFRAIMFIMWTIIFLVYTLRFQEIAKLEWTLSILKFLNRKIDELEKDMKGSDNNES